MADRSAQIQVIPPGLLGFLNLKTLGANPFLLGDTYQPTIELRDWLLQADQRDFTQDVALASVAIGFGASLFNLYSPNSIVVPSNEYWWVENYTIQTGNLGAATERCQFQCAMYTPITGTVNIYLMGDPSPDITGAATVRRNATRCGGFFAPSGAALGIAQYIQETAGNITYTGFVRFTRLRV